MPKIHLFQVNRHCLHFIANITSTTENEIRLLLKKSLQQELVKTNSSQGDATREKVTKHPHGNI